MRKRKICVVSGSRAEYGLLYWLIRALQQEKTIELQTIVTGMHLSPEFGLTINEIAGDGVFINDRVEMLLSSDTPSGIAKSVGLGVIGFADALERLKPDMLVVLGDRFEILAAAQAAMFFKIPIAHIHGGELTEGAIDDSIRHCITKMAHIHLVSAEPYRTRVIQLGENPANVYNVGALGIEQVLNTERMSRADLESSLQFNFRERTFLVTYHPVTLSRTGNEHAINNLLAALDEFPDASIIITKPNADSEGRFIAEQIDRYVSRSEGRVLGVNNLGRLRYLSAASLSDVVIGNSSSGVIEIPALQKPTVNIGDRQKGRLKGPSIIDCGESTSDIVAAIKRAVSPDFQSIVYKKEPLFGDGSASARMTAILKEIALKDIVNKSFYNT